MGCLSVASARASQVARQPQSAVDQSEVYSAWQSLTKVDVEAAYRLLRDNHPAASRDAEDPAFIAALDRAQKQGLARAHTVSSLDGYAATLREFDLYGLYGSGGVTKMEEKATDFVRRVVEKRLQHFCKAEPDAYFNTKSADLWKTLFYASMANPRIIGHLMLYAHEAYLLYGKKIGTRAVQEASQTYYEEKISPFFNTGKYKVVFEERSSIFSLKELLETVVRKARTIRQEGSRNSTDSKAHPFASHFYVSKAYDDLLHSLELAFFITKYFEQSDRTGARVSVYALNHGLCKKYQIGFGRPTDSRETGSTS